ncbi:MAG: hypothetical protein DPW16_12945 [Chloroflexi bacterium]|nr:hypothetical protein [Chloroflexota bacterium]
MNHPNPLSLPKPPAKRNASLNIRLTNEEKQWIERLAVDLNVAPSTLARHFVIQAVRFHLTRKPQDGSQG